MPLTPSFSVTQYAGNPSVIAVEDTSTGSDGTITSRRVFLRLFNNTYLVPTGTITDYVVWSAADESIDIDAVDKDYAIDVTVQWLAGSTVVYTDTQLSLLKDYGEQFKYLLTQAESGNQQLMNSRNYFAAKSKLTELLDSAKQAVEQYGDQTTAQLCLDEAKILIDNPSIFY